MKNEYQKMDMPSTSKINAKKLEIVWKTKTPKYTKWFEAEENYKNCLMQLETDSGNVSPVDMFENLFSNNIYDLIVEDTNSYAKDVKNDHYFNVITEDKKIFIRFLYFPATTFFQVKDCRSKEVDLETSERFQ